MSSSADRQRTLRTLTWGLAIALLGWSAVGNLLLGERWYVPRNLLLAALLLVLAARVGLGRAELGLDGRRAQRGTVWGAWSVAIVAIVLLGAVALHERIPAIAVLLADDRAALPPAALAFHALVRIPLGTAVFEEVAFRGVLLAAAARSTTAWRAILGTSAVFGVWHVPPTIVALRINDIAVVSAEGLVTIVGAVIVTAIAGVAFCWLRLRSGSLVAPVLAHWATNALGLLAAASTTTP